MVIRDVVQLNTVIEKEMNVQRTIFKGTYKLDHSNAGVHLVLNIETIIQLVTVEETAAEQVRVFL